MTRVQIAVQAVAVAAKKTMLRLVLKVAMSFEAVLVY
jgi:hypothetical protein